MLGTEKTGNFLMCLTNSMTSIYLIDLGRKVVNLMYFYCSRLQELLLKFTLYTLKFLYTNKISNDGESNNVSFFV